jgi:hypothetical protein
LGYIFKLFTFFNKNIFFSLLEAMIPNAPQFEPQQEIKGYENVGIGTTTGIFI